MQNSLIVSIVVGTPQGDGGSSDLSHVMEAVRAVAKAMDDYKIIVTKSTVPVGTADEISQEISALTTCEFDVVANPEFLKAGAAVEDFMKPIRVVIGASFLFPGLGYGGSCFPKDVKALIHIARENHYPSKLIKAVDEVNELQKQVVIQKILEFYSSDTGKKQDADHSPVKGKTFAIWDWPLSPRRMTCARPPHVSSSSSCWRWEQRFKPTIRKR